MKSFWAEHTTNLCLCVCVKTTYAESLWLLDSIDAMPHLSQAAWEMD